ncbi:MAG: ABC transporter substrate-binding protein [Gammaproteobacteria bacterium]|nr:ABC transporter substrate-binding protein [Gammaproteobacteria bacterium]MDH3859353.1 ABC transporter substrate-binding protein [Gammaproteobacteria bacterium]
MKDDKPKSELNFRDLTQADQDLVDKMVKGGSGTVTRRDAMKLAMVTGVSLVAAEHLLFDGKAAIAATPKKGGSVRMSSNLHGPDDQLDPTLFTSTIDYTRGRATYNSLIQHANDLSPQPELAESFEPNGNATEWTFKIRSGVTFHDGKKLTADDVVYTMKRHQGEDSTSVIKAVLASVKEWKKTGPMEVKAILESPNADLPTLLGLFQTKIVQNGSTGDGIGTGPFVMESFQPGVKSVHVRNKNYWREGAHLDACEITAITDPVARVNALISGDMQLVTQIEPNAFRQVESAKNVTLLSTPAALQMGICCLKNTEPGSNDDFVLGMKYIQDRERIVKRILKGKGTLGNDTPVSIAHGKDFCHELPQRQYDPDKAKFHFKKSGYSSAELFVAPVMGGIEDACLTAQANCAKIGFDLKLKKVPTDGYWGAVWMKEPLNVVSWNMRPTANSQMGIQFGPGAAWNDTFWNNERMGELLALSLAETDPVKRHDLYCEMQTLIHEGSGMVIPAFSNINDGIADNVMGMPTVPLGQLGACEWPEFIWLA